MCSVADHMAPNFHSIKFSLKVEFAAKVNFRKK